MDGDGVWGVDEDSTSIGEEFRSRFESTTAWASEVGFADIAMH